MPSANRSAPSMSVKVAGSGADASEINVGTPVTSLRAKLLLVMAIPVRTPLPKLVARKSALNRVPLVPQVAVFRVPLVWYPVEYSDILPE